MSLPRILALLTLALAAFAAACTRSASTPPPEDGETQDPQQATMEAVRSALLTQTAEAGGEVIELPTEPPPTAVVQPTATTVPTEAPTTIPTVAPPTAAATAAPTDTGSPTATPTPRPTTPPSGGGTIHVVKPGEWIWSIARIYGVDPNAIIAANNLEDPALIYPGDELIIP